MNRWYVRCPNCLSIGAVEEEPQRGWLCGICDHALETMGQVSLDEKRLEKKIEAAICDKRCTHAIGPLCVCKCHCKHHGSGRVVIIIRDAGKIPIIDLKAEDSALEKALAFQEVLKALGELQANVMKNTMYRVWHQINRLLQDLKKSRTWKKRTELLEVGKRILVENVAMVGLS